MKYAKNRVSNPMATRIAFLFLITKEAYLAARFFIDLIPKKTRTHLRLGFIDIHSKKIYKFRKYISHLTEH